MANTVMFTGEKDPVVYKIRLAARSQGWTSMAGIKQWTRETYNATLRSGRHGNRTSITFKTESDLSRFKKDFGQKIIICPKSLTKSQYKSILWIYKFSYSN